MSARTYALALLAGCDRHGKTELRLNVISLAEICSV